MTGIMYVFELPYGDLERVPVHNWNEYHQIKKRLGALRGVPEAIFS